MFLLIILLTRDVATLLLRNRQAKLCVHCTRTSMKTRQWPAAQLLLLENKEHARASQSWAPAQPADSGLSFFVFFCLFLSFFVFFCLFPSGVQETHNRLSRSRRVRKRQKKTTQDRKRQKNTKKRQKDKITK